MQQRFSIPIAVAGLAILVSVLLAHRYFLGIPDREELGPRSTELRFEPAKLDAREFAPLRLAGAWTVASDDPRVGGISALAIDGDQLVALTDAGVVIRFAKPGERSVRAEIRELPGGPGDAGFKSNRDSEAVARDPAGRGWWVAFENRDQLWLYDSGFTRSLARISIPSRRLSYNGGVEGLAANGDRLLLFPEAGGLLLELSGSGWKEVPFRIPRRWVSDAIASPDGSLLVIERAFSLTGFANALARLKPCEGSYCLVWRKALPVTARDNLEAMAVERLESGTLRLWIATDDNLHRRLRTLLIAADLPRQQP